MCFEPTCQLWSGHERSELGAHKEPKHLLQRDREVLSLLLHALDQVPWFPKSLWVIQDSSGSNCLRAVVGIKEKQWEEKEEEEEKCYLCNLE